MKAARRKIEQIARWHVAPAIMRQRLRPPGRDDLERLGDEGGAWIVPTSLISAGSLCYCAGVGEDISFDRALVERFGCEVHAFDPTPRAIAYVGAHAADLPRFHFAPVGVWKEDAALRFFAPSDPAHVSHSAVNLAGTSEYFEAECRSLRSLMTERGHERIDLLKLDIEGAEFEVLGSMIDAGIRPAILCVEFDQPCSPRRVLRMCRRLESAGHRLVAIERWNYTFVADR